MNDPERVLPDLEGFLVAESIRPDTGNRFSILGVYTSGEVIVDRKALDQDPPILLSSLAFLFRFRNGVGDWKTSVDIRSPTGKEVGKGSMGISSFKNGKRGVVVVNASPFEVKEWGEYKVIVNLEDHAFEESFSIVVGDL